MSCLDSSWLLPMLIIHKLSVLVNAEFWVSCQTRLDPKPKAKEISSGQTLWMPLSKCGAPVDMSFACYRLRIRRNEIPFCSTSGVSHNLPRGVVSLMPCCEHCAFELNGRRVLIPDEMR